VKPRPFCIFLASAEAFLSRPVGAQWELPGGCGAQRPESRPLLDSGLGSRNLPFSWRIPGWMAQSAVLRDHRALESVPRTGE